jgi:hypothetical protein
MAAINDPARAGSGRTVFTDVAGRALLRLPLVIAAAALGLLLIGGFVLAWRRKALGKPLLVAAGMVFGGTVAAGVLSVGAGFIRAGDYWRAYPLVAYLAVYAVLLAAMSVIWARWGRGFDRTRMRAGAWLLILIFGGAASVALPGATIFFVIPPALALTGIALADRWPRLATGLSVAAILIQLVMIAQLLALMEMLLIDGPLVAVAPLAALAALPAIVETDAADSRPAALLLLGAAAVAWIAALSVPRASEERPLGFSVDYFRNADEKTANWAIATKQAPLPANYPGQWSKAVLPYNGRPRWVAQAPLLETPVPTARVIANELTDSGRRVRLMLSPGGGNSVSIRFPKDAKVRALGLAGAAIPIPNDGEPDKALLRCMGRSCEGLQVEVLLGDLKPVDAELFSTRFGLPPQGKPLLKARPTNSSPQYAPDQTITMAPVRL